MEQLQQPTDQAEQQAAMNAALTQKAFDTLDRVRSAITPFTYFQNEMDRDVIVAANAAGLHLLLGSEPGGGKTRIAKALAASMELSFGRLQGDPMNTTRHILGSRIFNQATGEYEFHEGPIFNNLFLADEANRNTGPTQAAFIEPMEEGQVTTVDGVTRKLPKVFRVIATQNPEDETEGINLMTAANTDRFGVFLDLSQPYSVADMVKVKAISEKADLEGGPAAVANEAMMLAAMGAIRGISRNADSSRIEHAQELVVALREHTAINAKASILNKARPALQMVLLASGIAALERTSTLTDRHIDLAAPYVLGHRTKVQHAEARKNGTTPQKIIELVVPKHEKVLAPAKAA